MMDEGHMIIPLSELAKMSATARLHHSTGETMLAGGGGGAPSGSLFPQNISSMKNQIVMGRPSSLFDDIDPRRERSLLLGMPVRMHPGSAFAGLGCLGMGAAGMGLGISNRIAGAPLDLISSADLYAAADRNQLKRERMVGLKMKQASSFVVTPGSELDSERTLAALGNTMRKKSPRYIDVSAMADPPEFQLAANTRGGVIEPFPEKLHRLLREIEKSGNGHVASFFPHGRAFGIYDTDIFEKKIMPKYFKHSRLSSFQRQLYLYGFTRIVSGSDTGGYYHELFLKGRPALCTHMRRVGKPIGVDRRKIKSTLNKEAPDFYSMRPSI